MKYYLAFSVHGTNKFFVLTREAERVEDLGPGFRVVSSRRPLYNPQTDGFKVHWTGLTRKKDGQPYTNPVWIRRRLRELQNAGWTRVQPY